MAASLTKTRPKPEPPTTFAGAHQNPPVEPDVPTIRYPEKWPWTDYHFCHYKLSHKPFSYWKPEYGVYVCDVCNWDQAGINGGVGALWQYPPAVAEQLKVALAQRGISLSED